MKISIITTCYNRQNTIADSIRSVLSQDYDDIEYIIVDGKSTDNSLNVIRDLFKDYKLIDNKTNLTCYQVTGKKMTIKLLTEPDRGMYEAINKGIKLATGDVVGFCHSDDIIYSPETVSHIAEKMTKTDCDLLYADGLYVNPVQMDEVIRKWIGGRYAKWKVRLGWLPLHTTCYIKRSVYNRCGLYNESYKIAADTDLLVHYLYECNLKVEYLEEYVTRMRMGGLSTDSKKTMEMWGEDMQVYSTYHFRPVLLTKLMKMSWKVPQFVKGKLM